MTPVTTRPACLDRAGAAAYLSLSESTIEKLTREGDFPQPRLLSGRRVGWLIRDLDEWLEKRPVSNLVPPSNTGARKGRSFTSRQDAPDDRKAA